MNRREFGKTLAIGAATAAVSQPNKIRSAPQKALMHVGCQAFETTKRDLQFLERYGVQHMDGPNCNFVLDDLVRAREQCSKFGVSMDMVHVDVGANIGLGISPARDKEIDTMCERIRISAKAGLRGLNYNFPIRQHLRTESTPGRGGSSYSTWVLAKGDTTWLEAKPIPLDEVFARIQYFLERVVPVAAENKVQLACHFPDPPTPPGFKGIDIWNYTLDGLKRFMEIAESPYHGFNFCCGTLAEGLKNPGKEIFDIVRYFGERKKIFNVHFRNIRGGLNNFQEVYLDEGDIDMYKLAKVFKEVGYPYMLMPDHAPGHPDEAGNTRVRPAWAFGFGYIKAMIQAVNSEA